MKIVVRGANWIGDAVMTIPALRTLRRAFPDSSISLHTRAWAEGVFKDADFIDKIIRIDEVGVFAQARELRRHQHDLSILFPNSFESALVTRLSGIPKRLGYSTQHRGFLLTDRVSIPEWKNEDHESRYYLNLIQHLTDTSADRLNDSALPVSAERRRTARKLIAASGKDESSSLIGFGAGSTNSLAKRWPAENFAQLADLLVDAGSNVVLLGAASEASVSAKVALAAKSHLTDLTGKTDLGSATAILSELDLFVSNDMGLAHIAAAVGTPTIVIFGPTNDVTTRPLGPSVEIIREPVECAPCMLRDCPIDHRCMTRISPERVFETVVKMLETHQQ